MSWAEKLRRAAVLSLLLAAGAAQAATPADKHGGKTGGSTKHPPSTAAAGSTSGGVGPPLAMPQKGSPPASLASVNPLASPASAAAANPKNGSEKVQPGQNIRPTGPITIDADRAEWEQNQSMLYTGHVKLNSTDLALAGDRLEIKQYGKGEFTAHIVGNPATLNHKGLIDKDGTVGPPVTARAKTLDYDSRNDTVTVDGDAVLTQGERQMQGEHIVYNVVDRRIEAKGIESGGKVTEQVHFTIPQPPPKTARTPATVPGASPGPADASPGPVTPPPAPAPSP